MGVGASEAEAVYGGAARLVGPVCPRLRRGINLKRRAFQIHPRVGYTPTEVRRDDIVLERLNDLYQGRGAREPSRMPQQRLDAAQLDARQARIAAAEDRRQCLKLGGVSDRRGRCMSLHILDALLI